jgi:hypothetical protein
MVSHASSGGMMQSAVAIVILVASSETILAMRIPIVFHCRQSRRIEDRQNPSKHTGKQRKGRILIVVYWGRNSMQLVSSSGEPFSDSPLSYFKFNIPLNTFVMFTSVQLLPVATTTTGV